MSHIERQPKKTIAEEFGVSEEALDKATVEYGEMLRNAKPGELYSLKEVLENPAG